MHYWSSQHCCLLIAVQTCSELCGAACWRLGFGARIFRIIKWSLTIFWRAIAENPGNRETAEERKCRYSTRARGNCRWEMSPQPRQRRIVSFGCGQSVGLAELAVPRHLEAASYQGFAAACCASNRCCLLREQTPAGNPQGWAGISCRASQKTHALGLVSMLVYKINEYHKYHAK